MTALEENILAMLRFAQWPVVQMSQRELDNLPEYSASLPTGVRIGKRWKRDVHFRPGPRRHQPAWLLCEYTVSALGPAYCDIKYSRIDVLP